MPWAPLRRCRRPGCRERQDGPWCAVHRTRQARGYDRDWERVRRMILERDGHVCQIRGPTCTGLATTVDHIVPLIAGGARLHPANLRAACARDNYSLGGKHRP